VNINLPRPAGHRELLIADRGDQPPARAAAGAVAGPSRLRAGDAEAAVTALYQVHAVGLIRLAVVMLGERPAAEDVVQDAFCALYRRWEHLADTGKALSYARSSILNGCRSELRRRIRNERRAAREPGPADTASAEVVALVGEEHREVLGALLRLPRRQREALVLRFYLDLSEPEIAASMGISPGTVKSTTSRALSALGRLLEGNSR
jgi:RNA polymerase sigma-70 factor (sigma-E family)